jgi:uncharacterized protein (DUF433 family)
MPAKLVTGNRSKAARVAYGMMGLAKGLSIGIAMTTGQRAALAGVITVDKEIMHGTPCFTSTRVPLQTLIDFLETGESVGEFLEVYPYIPREQVHAFLELSKNLTIEQICASS